MSFLTEPVPVWQDVDSCIGLVPITFVQIIPVLWQSYQIKNAEVQQLTSDVAIIGYNIHVVARYKGEDVTLDAADASTWVKKNGSWLCALHTEAPLGDPFGRDRQRPN